MTKEELQQGVVTSLEKNHIVILEWPTSLGKGYIGAKIITDTVVRQISHKKVLLVVAETLHKDNWKEEFVKQGFDGVYDRITVECYASLKNYRNTNWDLIVFDELHHAGTDLRIDILRTIAAKKILGLSATLKKDVKDIIISTFGGPSSVSRISLQQAIDKGWLPQPKIYLIPLTMDTHNKSEEIITSWGVAKKRVVIHCDFADRGKFINDRVHYPNVTLVMSCTPWEKYVELCSQIKFWKERYFATNNIGVKNKWLALSSDRKKLMGKSKTLQVEKFLKTLNKRYICFCTDIEQAEYLNSANCIHSQKTGNEQIVADFNDGKIDSLFCIGKAQEGMNLKNIEAGVIVQLSGSELVTKQRFGRAMRSEEPIQYIFYYKNTRDEEYLKKAIEDLDKNFISTITV